jgi:hypothetical protein
MTSFRLSGLDPAAFAPLFALDDGVLAARGIRRRRADAEFGYPCRVSLRDALPGEELLLLPFEHHAVDSPYRALGPIYVRRAAARARLAPGEVPPYVTRRLISVRAYDRTGMMLAADVVEGVAVAARLERQFADADTAYVHLHNARPGCFSCVANRA